MSGSQWSVDFWTVAQVYGLFLVSFFGMFVIVRDILRWGPVPVIELKGYWLRRLGESALQAGFAAGVCTGVLLAGVYLGFDAALGLPR